MMACHTPRKRMIQYSALFRFYLKGGVYSMPAFAGMSVKIHSR
jgi:hypothetical protein